MLANPQQHQPSVSYPYSRQHYHDLPSPSSAQLPFYFGSSNPSSSLESSQRPSTTDGLFENLPLMSTNIYSAAQNPPIRVYQSSPAPQLSETALSQHEWQSNPNGGQVWQNNNTSQLSRNSQSKHQRTSSGSSIGSGGPSSPYAQSTSHPQIANTDSSPSGLQAYPHYDFADQADGLPYVKASHDSQDSFLAPEFQNFNPSTQASESNVAAKLAMMRAMKVQQRDESPAPTYSASSRGHPSPRTPRTIYEGDASEVAPHGFNGVTPMVNNNTDTFNEDMYTSQFPTNAMPLRKTPATGSLLSPYRNIYNDRVQAANAGHMQMGSHSPASTISRERSPFENFNSAARLREQQKVERDALALQQHQYRPDTMSSKTVSPKDVTLEFNEPEVDMKTPLFPSEDSMDTDMQDFGALNGNRQALNYNYMSQSMPSHVQVPQQYPFIAQQRRQDSFQSRASATPEFPARLISMESSVSEGTYDIPNDVPKPSISIADSGTYTCTYHGCTLRFETPAKLQKHKREGHRQQTPTSTTTGMSSSALLRNSQAGPHKCERINPQTNKPCNTIFSRPYDLTRHEDTIHNGRKQKVRCQYCTEDKTFSRNDALTRHMRVVHPEIDFPGKIRKRHE